jgi:hypothetical protein
LLELLWVMLNHIAGSVQAAPLLAPGLSLAPQVPWHLVVGCRERVLVPKRVLVHSVNPEGRKVKEMEYAWAQYSLER